MQELINKIESLKKSNIKNKIDKRIQEFKSKKSIDEIFKELCFCILTANFNAEKSIKIQEKIGDCFLTDKKEELSKKLRKCGHRFPNKRAEYISESSKCRNKLKEVLKYDNKKAIRDWMVKNIDGIGYK
ncbi:MAG: N-glycosylase, partial [Candidatus Thermoplasmatota archaeon]|nr:N-glycosylase [Candidatus Thermoplasmatota archaeon]